MEYDGYTEIKQSQNAPNREQSNKQNKWYPLPHYSCLHITPLAQLQQYHFHIM